MSSPFTAQGVSPHRVGIFGAASYGKKKKKTSLPFYKRTEHLHSLVEQMNV